jgi:leucyl-tRNA synthetase
MELSNHLTKLDVRPRSVLEPMVLLLAPFAPHMAEELWSALGNSGTLAYAPWPRFDAAFTQATAIEIPVQINGKLRSKVMIAAGAEESVTQAAALADPRIQELLTGKTIRKAIVVPGKMVNLVVG